MKYIANPVEVDAYRIVSVERINDGQFLCTFELPPIGEDIHALAPAKGIASPEMTARMIPQPGDYWVIQSDGYVYLNPKEVFERKYRPKENV